MKYIIVNFGQEDGIAIASEKWLGKNDLDCWWPPYKDLHKVEKAARNHEDSHAASGWKLYPVEKIMYKHESWEKVRGRLPVAEYTSHLETDASDIDTNNNKRKRRPVKRSNTYGSFCCESAECESDADCDDSDSVSRRKCQQMSSAGMPSPPPPPIPHTPTPQPATPKSRTPQLPTAATLVAGDQQRSTISDAASGMIQQAGSSSSCASVAEQSRLTSTPSAYGVASGARGMQVFMDEMRSQMNTCNLRMFTLLEELKAQSQTQLLLLQQLVSRSLNSQEVDMGPLPDGLTLPVNNINELDHLNAMTADADIKGKVIRFLSQVGGCNCPDTTRRVMKKLMVKNVAMQFNWMGRGQKRGFRGMLLTPVICDAVRRNPVTCRATDHDVHRVMKSWLQGSRDHDNGRRDRDKRSQQVHSDITRRPSIGKESPASTPGPSGFLPRSGQHDDESSDNSSAGRFEL